MEYQSYLSMTWKKKRWNVYVMMDPVIRNVPKPSNERKGQKHINIIIIYNIGSRFFTESSREF